MRVFIVLHETGDCDRYVLDTPLRVRAWERFKARHPLAWPRTLVFYDSVAFCPRISR